jgi:hypothetical protein
VLSEKRTLCLRLLKNKGFKNESMTKGGSYAIGTSTSLESNKSHRDNLNYRARMDIARCGKIGVMSRTLKVRGGIIS